MIKLTANPNGSRAKHIRKHCIVERETERQRETETETETERQRQRQRERMRACVCAYGLSPVC